MLTIEFDIYSQIHSQDDRFGDSDLGIRGMALFFVSFRRNPVCDYLKLPRFPLSSKERNRMATAQKKSEKKIPIGTFPLCLMYSNSQKIQMTM